MQCLPEFFFCTFRPPRYTPPWRTADNCAPYVCAHPVHVQMGSCLVFSSLRILETTTNSRILRREFKKSMAHTYLPLGLSKIEHYSDIRLIQELTHAFNDRPVLRMGRVRDPFVVEFRSWLERAWTAASCGIPINPTLKRQFLYELYDFI